MQDSSFINGISVGISNKPFSGNAGGIAIGYQPGTRDLQDSTPNITVSRCRFMNNTASAIRNRTVTVLEVLRTRIYNQRGGGIALYFGTENFTGNVNIENSHFTSNIAEDSGGGVYMFLNGKGSSHNIIICSTIFTNNTAQDGGGLEITHSNPDSVQNPNSIEVINCTFNKNRGRFGGGYKNIQLNDLSNMNYLNIQNTVFDDNEAEVGAGIYLQSVETVRKATLLNRISMESW